MRMIALCLFSCIIFLPKSEGETRHAFVIGNDNYPGHELRNAVNDATAVYGSLKAVGYQSTLLLNADRSTLIDALGRYVDTLHPGDTTLLYYAGHGLQVAGENYLVPTDFTVISPGAVKDQGYSLSTILDLFTAHGATTQVIILDSCRDNPFLGTRSVKGGWSAVGTSAGQYLAFGTSPGTTASDDPAGNHGLFTKYLLQFLTKPSLDIEDMFKEVRQGVIRESRAQQVPWTASSLIGTFHVRPDQDANSPSLPWIEDESNTGAFLAGRTMGNEAQGRTVVSSIGETAEERAQIARAIGMAKLSHFAEAIALLQDVLSIWPESSIALRLLGLLLHHIGRDAEALATFTRAMQVNQGDATAAAYQCAMQSLLSVTTAPIQCELAARTNPSGETYLAFGVALEAAGDDLAASHALDVSLSFGPSSLAYSLRGDLESRRGLKSLAASDYSLATELAPSQSVP